MPAATFDSAWCLARFNQFAGRPPSDSITDAAKYLRLTDAQNHVIALMAGVCPNALYPQVAYASLPTLTTTDNKVYTFGTDANLYAKFPMGHGGIYTSPNDIPDSPLRPGRDYMVQGTSIRSMNNTTLPATLYWYGIGNPADMDATNQPAIFPEAARELIVIEAVRQFGKEGVRNPALVGAMDEEWNGTGDARRPGAWPRWCLVWKTQFRSGGAVSYVTGRDFALAGQL